MASTSRIGAQLKRADNLLELGNAYLGACPSEIPLEIYKESKISPAAAESFSRLCALKARHEIKHLGGELSKSQSARANKLNRGVRDLLEYDAEQDDNPENGVVVMSLGASD